MSFNFLHLSFAERLVIIGVIIGIIAFFFPWMNILYWQPIIKNAFSQHVGYVWFVGLIVLAFIGFLILSNREKERMKTNLRVNVQDAILVTFSGVLLLSLTYVVSEMIYGYSLLFQNVSIGKWALWEAIGGIFILVWWLFSIRERKREVLRTMYIENPQSSAQDLEEYRDILGKDIPKDNLSLPI